MRPSDRLFQIIQILRRSRRPLTAEAIAGELETSKRTVYRDISALVGQRVPIRGEAGLGYVLDGGFDLPPLMLSAEEMEAAVLGARWVESRADPALARAASDLIGKLAAIVPEHLRDLAFDPASRMAPAWDQAPDCIDLARARKWIHEGRKIGLSYKDEQGRESQRIIWPVVIGYYDCVRHVIAWCELRKDFRSFRTDRIIGAEFLEQRYPERPGVLRARWQRTLKEA